jgi:hypothetical protein
MRAVRLPLLVFIVFLSACDGLPFSSVCTTESVRAIEVEVRDAATGVHLAAGASGIVRDGAFSEELQVVLWSGPPPHGTATTLGGVYERAGHYSVVITHPGYQEWRQDGVRVDRDRCHVRTARFHAELVREP